MNNIKLEDILNYQPTSLDRIRWSIKRKYVYPLSIIRKIKSFFQRGRRGWADSDIWNADIYLARIIADTLEWYASDKSAGVSMKYATEEDPWGKDIEGMVDRRNKDYLQYAAIFREFSVNGIAFDEDWKNKYGGVYEEEIKQAVIWLAEIYTSLWD